MRNSEFAKTNFDAAMGAFKKIQSNDKNGKEGTLALGLASLAMGLSSLGNSGWGSLRQAAGDRQKAFAHSDLVQLTFSKISSPSTWQCHIPAENREPDRARDSKGKRRNQVRLRADLPQKRTAQGG
jgi:hypothetical protein